MNIYIRKDAYIQIIKSLKDSKLEYFKNKLLKILDAKEKQESVLSKAIDIYFNSIEKCLYNEYGIEKGRLGTVGEIRTWKDGKKYKKMPNGKWVRVYQEHNRSAEISIARLKGKVRNAKSVDELFEIVKNNIHRFEDKDGKILPVVLELKKEVDNTKKLINTGKKIVKKEKDNSVKQTNGIDNEIESLTKEFQNITETDPDKKYSQLRELNIKVNKVLDSKIKDLKEKTPGEPYDNPVFIEEYNKLYSKFKNIRSVISDELDNTYYKTTEYLTMKKEIRDSRVKKLEQRQKRNAKSEEKQAKINEIAEKMKSNTSIETLESEIPELNKLLKEKEHERLNLSARMDNMKRLINIVKNDNKTDYEYKGAKEDYNENVEYVKENTDKLKALKKECESLKLKLDAKTNIYADMMEEREYIPDTRIEKCNSLNDVNKLFDSNNWFKGNEKTNLRKIDLKSAKEVYKCFDRMFNKFPFMKGIEQPIREVTRSDRIYAEASFSEIAVNEKYFKDFDKTALKYSKDIQSKYHPMGTDLRCVFYHEFAHTIDYCIFKAINWTPSKDIQSAVLQTFKGHSGISKELSEYAKKNNKEFFAEGLSEALNSATPRRFAKECLRQLYKNIVLYKASIEKYRKENGVKL